MPIETACPSCSTRLRIPDNLLGSGQGVKCPKCRTSIYLPVPGRPAAADSERVWYVAQNKQKLGPFSLSQLKRQAQAGELKLTDMVLQQGATRWITAGACKDLLCVLSSRISRQRIEHQLEYPEKCDPKCAPQLPTRKEDVRQPPSVAKLNGGYPPNRKWLLSLLIGCTVCGLSLLWLGCRGPHIEELKYPDGQVQIRRSLVNGKLHGPVTIWYRSGAKLADATFIFGRMESQILWYEDGAKMDQINLEWRTVPCGRYVCSGSQIGWDHGNHKEFEGIIEDRCYINTINYYPTTGHKRATQRFVLANTLPVDSPLAGPPGAVHHGLSSFWYKNGQKCSTIEWQFGELRSESYWSEDGRPLTSEREIPDATLREQINGAKCFNMKVIPPFLGEDGAFSQGN